MEQCSIVLYKFAFKFRLKVVHILQTSLLHGPFLKVQPNCSVEVEVVLVVVGVVTITSDSHITRGADLPPPNHFGVLNTPTWKG